MLADLNGNLSSLGIYLARAGWSVTHCGVSSELVLKMKPHAFDFLITDMPVDPTSGLALLDWVTINRPEVRVIALTSSRSQSLMNSALIRGVKFYLELPVEPETVEKALLSLVDRNSFPARTW